MWYLCCTRWFRGWNSSCDHSHESYWIVLSLGTVCVFKISTDKGFFSNNLKLSELLGGKCSAEDYNRSIVYSLVSTEDLCVSCWFCLSTAPGLGYGLIWNKGPLAVVSTPVLASPFFSKPVVHVPLREKYRSVMYYAGINWVAWFRAPRTEQLHWETLWTGLQTETLATTSFPGGTWKTQGMRFHLTCTLCVKLLLLSTSVKNRITGSAISWHSQISKTGSDQKITWRGIPVGIRPLWVINFSILHCPLLMFWKIPWSIRIRRGIHWVDFFRFSALFSSYI